MIKDFIQRSGAAFLVALVAVVFVTGTPGGAVAQGWFDLSRRAPEPAPGVDRSAEIADLSLRIDRLEDLVRRLTGEVEVLRHRLGEDGAPAAVSSAPSQIPYAAAVGAPSAAYPAPAPQVAAQPEPAPEMTYEEAVRAFNDRAASEYGGQPAGQGAPVPGGPTPLLPPASAGGQVVLGAPEYPLGTIPASALRGTTAEPSSAPAGGAGQTVASLDGAVIEDAYSQAYSLMIAQDYPAAEGAFQTFIARYPGHELAGNAQYWLAETFYARGDYRRAAQEFLAGYQTYASSTKAPDSLLKLGMTLAALGQNEQACASFSEIAGRFPNADPAIIERSRSEGVRVGC